MFYSFVTLMNANYVRQKDQSMKYLYSPELETVCSNDSWMMYIIIYKINIVWKYTKQAGALLWAQDKSGFDLWGLSVAFQSTQTSEPTLPTSVE